MVDESHGLGERHWRELQRRARIAERVDRRHGATERAVHHHGAVGAQLHAQLLEADAARVRAPADGEQHVARGEHVAVVQAHVDAAGARLERGDLAAELQVHAALARLARDHVGDLVVEAAQHAFAAMDLHHVRTQPREDGRELAGDVAAAHDHQPRRQVLEVEHLVGYERQVIARDLGHLGDRAGGDEDLLGLEPALALGRAHHDRVRLDEPRVAGDQRGADVVQQATIDAVESRHLAQHAVAQHVPL